MFSTIRNYGDRNASALSADSLEVIVWGTCGGILLGVLCSVIHKHYTSAFIRALIRENAVDEESAQTLDRLKVKGRWYLKSSLDAPQKALRRYVECVGEGSDKGKADLKTARFYLPEDKKSRAELRFSGVRHPLLSVLLPAGLTVLAAVFALYTAPELMQMLQNFLSSLES